MNKIIKVYYWSPYTSKVATIRAVLNSAYSLKKYSNGKIAPKIIDALGEWKKYNNEIKNADLDYSLLTKSEKFLESNDKTGYLKSRLFYILIFLKSFFPLKNLILKEKPDFLIIHLLTSLPLILNILFNLKTKIILRISGLPQMNFLRKILWKIAINKIYLITCPTNETKNDLIKLNICKNEKIVVLNDPVLNIKKINIEKNQKNFDEKFKDYFLSIGRFTRQKNFLFLVEVFSEYIKNKSEAKLIIIGEGEEKNKVMKYISENNLSTNIKLYDYKENIFPYLKKAKCFLLSSLWEDPGFVLVESAYCNISIISSDCKNGPTEILSNGDGGFLYKTNSKTDFLEKIINFENCDNKKINRMKIISKRKIKSFTLFSHYLKLNEILQIK